jgi:hypothetical protein
MMDLETGKYTNLQCNFATSRPIDHFGETFLGAAVQEMCMNGKEAVV